MDGSARHWAVSIVVFSAVQYRTAGAIGLEIPLATGQDATMRTISL